MIEKGTSQKEKMKDLRTLGKFLQIEVDTLLHRENEDNFDKILEGLFDDVHLSEIEKWIRY